LIDFIEVDAEGCSGVGSSLLGDVLDDGLDVLVFPHVGGALLALLFKTLEDRVEDCSVSLGRSRNSIKICVQAWSFVCVRH
jgi:hypothetical protein